MMCYPSYRSGMIDSMPTSGSIPVLLATNGRGRFFRSLGSRRAVLAWDVETKVVSIMEVDKDGAMTDTIMSINVQLLTQVFILNGNYILRTADETYDMEITHFKGQRPIIFDAMGAEVGGLMSAIADAKGSGDQFIEFIKQELPPQMVAVSILRSRTHVKMTIIFAILFIVILVGIGALGALQK